MEFQTNTDLLEAIKEFQKSLDVSGNTEASVLVLEGMSCLNGLTDGWAQLLESLSLANNKYASSFTQQQSTLLKQIHGTVYKLVYRA